MRNVPSLNNQLLFFMRNSTEEVYHEKMIDMEKSREKDLIKIFNQTGIQASVKSNRYSLPYTNEIVHTGYGESYLNTAYDPAPFFRKIMKELFQNDIYKIRFYVLIEVEDSFPMGKVNFHFRYYKH